MAGEDGARDAAVVAAGEGYPAGEKLEGEDPEGPDVGGRSVGGPRVPGHLAAEGRVGPRGRVSQEHLGRHGDAGADVRECPAALQVEGEPKVGEEDTPAAVEEDVLELDVAVHDAAGVDVGEGAEEGRQDMARDGALRVVEVREALVEVAVGGEGEHHGDARVVAHGGQDGENVRVVWAGQEGSGQRAHAAREGSPSFPPRSPRGLTERRVEGDFLQHVLFRGRVEAVAGVVFDGHGGARRRVRPQEDLARLALPYPAGRMDGRRR